MTVIFTTSVEDKRAYLSGLVISKIVTNVRLSVFLKKTLKVLCLFYAPHRTLSKKINPPLNAQLPTNAFEDNSDIHLCIFK